MIVLQRVTRDATTQIETTMRKTKSSREPLPIFEILLTILAVLVAVYIAQHPHPIGGMHSAGQSSQATDIKLDISTILTLREMGIVR